MRRISTLGAPLVLAAAIVAAGCGGEPEHAAEAASPMAVTTAAAREITVQSRLEAGGAVEARDTAMLSSRVMAPVREVRVRAGDRVRAGQVLVVLDARDLAAQASQASGAASAAAQAAAAAKTDFAAAEAEHKLAASWHQRIAALHAKNSATAQELDDAEARLASAAARLAGAKARIEQAGANVGATRAGAEAAAIVRGYATVTAPFDGLVTETFADPGDLASPGTPLVRVDSGGALQVKVLVDESRAAFVLPGAKADVAIGTAPPVEGTVNEVSREVGAGSRSFAVTVVLPPGIQARTGTFARVQFRGAERKALVVPAAAVVRQGQVASAYVVEGEVARLRLLRTGDVLPEGIEVLAGLDAGERVVTPPPHGLVDGRRVTAGGAGSSGDRK